VTAGQSANQTITSNGIQRSYILHVPARYNAQASTPLVVNLHGLGSNDSQEESYTQYSAKADQAGFIVAYPQGRPVSGNQLGWNAYGLNNTDDVLFISDLLTKLQQQLCVDAHRIYSTGISMGGGMTSTLACNLSGRIAAFSGIAAAIHTTGSCNITRPVPFQEFHGTSDPIVPYNGTSFFPAIMTTMQAWATRDGCKTGPTQVSQQADITLFRWSNCNGGVVVDHYQISGGGHTWPGAQDNPALGATTHTISATDLSWQFFQQFTLP
jgi:polyhydroxybutyrate depolymerase